MSDEIDIEPLEAGYRVLIPNVEYEVVRQFNDNEGKTHPNGEKWEYLGWKMTRGFSGRTIFGKSGASEVISFTLLSRIREQELVFNSFENYVVGKPPPSPEFINRLDTTALEALTRCEKWMMPVPDSSEDMFRRLNSARVNAYVANGRAGYQGNPFEKIEDDLDLLFRQLIAISKNA